MGCTGRGRIFLIVSRAILGARRGRGVPNSLSTYILTTWARDQNVRWHDRHPVLLMVRVAAQPYRRATAARASGGQRLLLEFPVLGFQFRPPLQRSSVTVESRFSASQPRGSRNRTSRHSRRWYRELTALPRRKTLAVPELLNITVETTFTTNPVSSFVSGKRRACSFLRGPQSRRAATICLSPCRTPAVLARLLRGCSRRDRTLSSWTYGNFHSILRFHNPASLSARSISRSRSLT